MRLPQWEVEFYEKANGDCPVQEFLDDLQAEDHRRVNNAIERLEEHGLALIADRDYVAYLRDDIYELRVRVRKVRYRLLFFICERVTPVVLHAIKKKSGDVTDQDIDKSIERKNDYLARKRRGQQL
jgi:phage-related protein